MACLRALSNELRRVKASLTSGALSDEAAHEQGYYALDLDEALSVAWEEYERRRLRREDDALPPIERLLALFEEAD